jgi:recombination protein RecT
MSNSIAERQNGAPTTKDFSQFLDKLKPQMSLALPQHMKADRMARLALTAFSSNIAMQRCSFQSIAASLMNAGALGLEPGVNGAGYLIPYGQTCTFVPGWKGLVDLVSRSGRATVWTGAVFEGDQFDYALGDRPFVMHRPGDEMDPSKLTHVYSVGRVNGSEYPVIEVWSMRKVWKHRDDLNKQGRKHYSFTYPEMYARKVPLLQVLKYMPCSVEVANAIALSEASEMGRGAVIDGTGFVTVTDLGDGQQQGQQQAQQDEEQFDVPMYPEADFAAGLDGWRALIASGKKTADQVITMLSAKGRLSDQQVRQIKTNPSTGEVVGANQ